jgi:hypothetical protein
MERGQDNLDIETLFRHGGVREQELLSIFKPEAVEEHHNAWEEYSALSKAKAVGPSSNPSKKELRRVENAVWREWSHKQLKRQPSPQSESDGSDSEEIQEDHVVKGSDIGDAPTQYVAKGLLQHEMPVIGTYVDKRIVTGWQYHVRSLEGGQKYFGGRALALQSIGMGYGKRLTFESERYNKNNNYFWSDSQTGGYAFSLDVVESGCTFLVYDEDDRQIGTAYIEVVNPAQMELSSTVDKDTGRISKNVAVTFHCAVRYGADPHGILSLFSEQELQLTGVAISQKEKRQRRATLTMIKVSLPNFGPCLFFPDEE